MHPKQGKEEQTSVHNHLFSSTDHHPKSIHARKNGNEVTGNNAFSASHHFIPILFSCDLRAGGRRSDHIVFASIHVAPACDDTTLQTLLRQMTLDASVKHKKIEIFTADAKVLHALARLGYQYRGEKMGSCLQEGMYYNEAACDFSFFDMTDAFTLTTTLLEKSPAHMEVITCLQVSQTAILEAHIRGEIDAYGLGPV